MLTSSGKTRKHAIKIEKGVPIPQSAFRTRYQFHLMRVGNSIHVRTRAEYLRLNSARNYFVKKKTALSKGKRFIVRQTEDGWRCWRVK